VGDEPHEVQTIAHADPPGLPLQRRPVGAIAHEEYLGARVLEQVGGRIGRHQVPAVAPTHPFWAEIDG